MTPDEAKTFLQAWQNYLRHFSVPATQRTIDLVTACSVTLFMYVPRAVAVGRRRKAPPAVRPPQTGPAQVFQFRPSEPPPRTAHPPNAFVGNPPPPQQPPQAVAPDMTYEPQLEMEPA
jgi:hypothetical protein